ncbi:MAG: hypothetical protein F9K44_02620 [Hyphomicrobiaceae bacterium]|nr:MAG: hypothetical protein F9K44_02620 [Hyphomicrobiaceae bacterium]
MAADIVIDERGEIISTHQFVERRRRLKQPVVVFGGLERAACRLGFAAVRQLRLGLQLFFSPEALETAALVRLAYLIRDSASMRSVVVLSAWDGADFSHRIVRSASEAIGLLASMASSPGNRYSRGPLSRLAVKRQDMPSRLQRCVDGWTDDAGRADVELLTGIVQQQTNDRFVTFERVDGSPSFVLRDYGRNNPGHALRWYEGNIGKPLRSDDLDLAYHWFCNGAYRNALALQHPLCELVEAHVQPPKGSPMRRRYHRIILPFYKKSRQLVLVATQPHCLC